MLALGLEATTVYGVTAPEIRIGDVGLFSAFVAALDLAPAWKRRLIKDFNRKWSLAHDLDQFALAATNGPPEYQGVLAALAGSDPQGGASPRHRSFIDRRHRRGRRPLRRRDRRAISGTGGARRRTRLPRETRALIERFLAVRGDPDEAAGELRALAADAKLSLGRRSTCSRPAPAFSPRAALTCAPSASRRVRTRHRLLHRLRVRTALPPRQRPADRRRALRWLADEARRAAPIPAVGFAASIEELAGMRSRAHERAPLILAVPSKGRLQQNAEASSRAPGWNSSSRAAPATIAAPSPASTASKSPISRPAKSRPSSPKARCISASPARTWCAR